MKHAIFQNYRDQSEWNLRSAESDREHGFHDWACFKAQQAAELVVNGYIRSTDHFVTGHSVQKLLGVLATQHEVPDELLRCALELDKVYIPSRYPDAFPDGAPHEFFTADGAAAHIACAEQIQRFIVGLAS